MEEIRELMEQWAIEDAADLAACYEKCRQEAKYVLAIILDLDPGELKQ